MGITTQISGAGGLTIIGGGVVNIPVDQTYTGSTVIQSGALSVTAQLASSNILVNPNGILNGTGARNNAFGVAGFTAQLGPYFSAYGYYNPQFGGGQVVSHGVLAGVSWNF